MPDVDGRTSVDLLLTSSGTILSGDGEGDEYG